MDDSFFAFVAVGFVAQLIDGALGMAYGVASTTALVFLGVPPAIASANVHVAEVFTTAASGTSHAIARNIDWRLFRRLALAGSTGAVLGAFFISFIHADAARPLIAAYLFVMGLVVISKALKPPKAPTPIEKVRLLGFVGGFADASGGGGWGPVVVSNLLAKGAAPAIAVGTVNLAEFAVTISASVAFFAALGPTFGKAALGLVIGGVVAAPLAAIAAKRLPRRTLTALVGVVICGLSLFNLYTAVAG
ncbi:sulfite exporter TauE/SafE family protein [Hyphococcus sp.]|uniref:sulfite exporter TauE/SafE family protein n=1 Tax=Hyphococcus sp. TaxID=2038636 RepID=UPI0035C70CCB